MKLSFETIKNITVGALRVEQLSDGIHFFKCTKAQSDAWLALHEDLGRRALSTSGVRLDFHTNSSTFGFEVSSGLKYDLYINNVLTEAIKIDRESLPFSFSTALNTSNGENRITLIFPSLDIPCVLNSVTLDDGASVERHNFDCKMLFMGDSITQGCNAGFDSLSYAHRVSNFFNAESVIQGIGAGVFHESIAGEDINFDPDIVIIAFGTNDWGWYYKTHEEIEAHANAFLDVICKKFKGKKIYGISPIWRSNWDAIKPSGTFEQTCETVKKAHLSHGVTLIDGMSLMPHILDFYTDGLHPNATGFGIYAQNLIKELLK